MVSVALLALIIVLTLAVVLLRKGMREQFTVSQREQRRRFVQEYREDQTAFIDEWREQG